MNATAPSKFVGGQDEADAILRALGGPPADNPAPAPPAAPAPVKRLPRRRQVKKGSFFSDCPRDKDGHCKPKNSGDEAGAGPSTGAGGGPGWNNVTGPAVHPGIAGPESYDEHTQFTQVPKEFAADAQAHDAYLEQNADAAAAVQEMMDDYGRAMMGETVGETVVAKMRKCPETLDCLGVGDRELVERLERAVGGAPPLSHPVKVFRGLSMSSPEEAGRLVGAAEAARNTGSPFPMGGLTSTSLRLEPAATFAGGHHPVVFCILAKSGLYLGRRNEQSELLQSSKARYRVLGTRKSVLLRDSSYPKGTVGHNGRPAHFIYLEEV